MEATRLHRPLVTECRRTGPGRRGERQQGLRYPRIHGHHWMHGDPALFWPNGNLATEYFHVFDVTRYYPDGHNIIT